MQDTASLVGSCLTFIHPAAHGQGLRIPVVSHGRVLGEVKVPQGTQALIPFSHSVFRVILGGEGYELFAQLLYESSGLISPLAIIGVCAALLVWISRGQEERDSRSGCCVPTLNSY